MDSKFKRYFSFLIIISLIIAGCKKFVSVPPPITQITSSSVFESNSTATAALVELYTSMSSNEYIFDLYDYTGLSSDELTNYNSSQITVDLYTNGLNASNDAPILPWSTTYNYIYGVNAIIQGLQSSNSISSSVKNQLKGEAEFLRAYWYLYLTNLYGDVPLITTIDYTQNVLSSRTAQVSVYQQIIADLKDAQTLLNVNYIDASDTTLSTDKVRPNKWAATALLSRVYLYSGDYANAELQASSVINSGIYNLSNDLNSVFLENSSEAIWELLPVTPGYNTWEGYNWILTDGPGTSSTLSNQLLNAFEPGDKRLSEWVGTDNYNGTTYYFPYKYKVQTATGLSEYEMILRLGEQYLIRAEARAQQGTNLSGAAADLNIIRTRAGLPNTTASTQAALLAAILHERQVELFTEGHRWLDLKRTNNVNAIMSVVTPQKGGTWNSYQQLYPLPPTDIATDSHLIQNTGY